jgi:biopolymer transport protein ExbB/TolQ
VNLLPILENGLFALGQVLRFPVFALLWVCVAAAVFMTASCVVDFVARRRERRTFDITAWLKSGPADGGLEHLVLEREERVRRPLNLARMMVRVGPSLGLLGTLIPMGASLASMAAGNLEAMAGQMVVAFTSTIIGLATGTLAYVVAAARQNWVTETIREQRYLAEQVAREMQSPIVG